jgi:hypothetical protein
MSSLREKCMIVHIAFSVWTSNKLDKGLSAEANDKFGSSADSVKVIKQLLPTATMKQLREIKTRITKLFKTNTLPWKYDGSGILPSKLFVDFKRKYDLLVEVWKDQVEEFLTDYPEMINSRRLQMGSHVFKESEFPSVSKLRNTFSINITFEPISSASDFRCDLEEEHIKQLKEDLEKQIQETFVKSVQSAFDRLFAVVKHYADSLKTDDKVFRNGTISKIPEICSILDSLNVQDEPVLREMIQEVRTTLTVRNPEDLRNNKILRKEKATKAQSIAEKMKAFVSEDRGDSNEE